MTDVSPQPSAALPTSLTILPSRDVIFNTQYSPDSIFHQDNQNTSIDSHVTIQEDLTGSEHQSPLSHGSLGDMTANVQESCLLRYFIEELSPWVC